MLYLFIIWCMTYETYSYNDAVLLTSILRISYHSMSEYAYFNICYWDIRYVVVEVMIIAVGVMA